MIFSVKSPILGFEHIKTMELIELDKFFVKLASKDDETSFTMINPFANSNLKSSSLAPIIFIIVLGFPTKPSSSAFTFRAYIELVMIVAFLKIYLIE